ncbi:NIL domain-containing protein [Chloroflexota bacterium]
MTKRRVMFTFTEDQIKEPIIHNLGQQFNIVTNIRQADLSEDEGWIIVELEGGESDIEQGITWVTSKGVRVDSIDEDIAES